MPICVPGVAMKGLQSSGFPIFFDLEPNINSEELMNQKILFLPGVNKWIKSNSRIT